MGTMPLTPADIRNKKFHTVRLRPGYNEEDVDALLDRIEATLVALEGGPRTGPLLTADEIRNSRFRTTRMSPGYREDEVDDFLDLVVADLAGRGLGQPASPPPLPPHPGQADPGQPPGQGQGQGYAGPNRTDPQSGGPEMAPRDIREKRFATTRLTTGYNEQEVDDFLDRAEYSLEVLLQGRPDRATLTSAEVERVQFATTRARPGYDPAQVDQFLDELAEEFRRHERS
ncbi:DivIVA domain-containing protein [Nocardiopsis sp. L17-MgMaSL7]|uniref:DivIVA domain-containing protein n=1 Tax=Nocardiopsis sp. L17-MgMaSL7 TaxID=1938893 RepID=UPI000D715CD1|nr:DivIVA domain-containing protein [Nocardiopsis sp. L17-MgMaSL7]PWV45745.1 DivIVA domain-containing protein [Nocardiopsis sp. L17-MgMaSL7]